MLLCSWVDLPKCLHAQVPAEAASKATTAAGAVAAALQAEYGALERQLAVKLVPAAGAAPDQALSEDSAARLLALLLTLPHGVLKYSHSVPGMSIPLCAASALAALGGDSAAQCNKAWSPSCTACLCSRMAALVFDA